jgi:hypothetical protein
MNTARPAPPLPPPPQPAAAAHGVTEAARAAASAWAHILPPAAHSRAVSQLHSVLRDLGIASRGLAAYQASDTPPGPQSDQFRRHVGSGSRWLLSAWECLDGVLAAEGIPPSGEPDEPGAALCQAARDAILAWRQPQGTTADRDETVRRLVIATGFISAAIASLATYAPRQATMDLQTAGTRLAEATAALSAAARLPRDNPAPGRQAVPDER